MKKRTQSGALTCKGLIDHDILMRAAGNLRPAQSGYLQHPVYLDLFAKYH